MAVTESRKKQLMRLSALVSHVLRDFLLRALCLYEERCATAFNFPYRHSENSALGELRLLGEGFGPDNFTDPMEREDVAQLLR